MAILRIIGNRLLTQDEVQSLEASNLLQRLADARDSLTSIDIGGAPLTMEALHRASRAPSPGAKPGEPIAIGEPLTITLDYVYTGDFPRSLGNLGHPDLLVTSAVRPSSGSKATAKALNLLKQDVRRNSYCSLSAGDDGTAVIFHTPALTDQELLVDLDLAVERVDQEAFDQVSGFLSKAAAIPLFLGCGSYLLAGSVVVKMVGSLAEFLFDRAPWLADSERLFIGSRPGVDAKYGGLIFCRKEDEQELKRCEITPDGRLVRPGTDQTYQGNAPFATAFMDGRVRADLKKFEPSAASIELLDRFYRIKERDREPSEILLNAMSLYSDFEARKKVDDLDRLLKNLDKKSEEYKRQAQLREAWRKKIQNNEIFNPPAGIALP